MSFEDIQNVVKKVKKSLFKKFNDRSFGILKSHLRGLGMEFKEHKLYSHGDDLRFVDWKILARTMHPYVKIFEQERNLEILIVVDASLSMLIGYKEVSKLQAAIDVSIFLYFFSQKTQYKIHTVILGEKILDIPKGNGEKGLISFITQLRSAGIINDEGKVEKSYRPKSTLSEEEKLAYISKVGFLRKEVILLSDFFQFLPEKKWAELLSRKNVHGIRIVSPVDEAINFPFRTFGLSAGRVRPKRGLIFSGKDDSRIPPKIGQKLRRLSVASPYLDEFVREFME